MSRFYLLPPHSLLGVCLAGRLKDWLPDLEEHPAAATTLADAVVKAIERQPDSFVVHRDELPDEDDPAASLVDAFGADPGDAVVELRAGARPGELTARQWRIPAGDPITQ